jgi:hypothetical protein
VLGLIEALVDDEVAWWTATWREPDSGPDDAERVYADGLGPALGMPDGHRILVADTLPFGHEQLGLYAPGAGEPTWWSWPECCGDLDLSYDEISDRAIAATRSRLVDAATGALLTEIEYGRDDDCPDPYGSDGVGNSTLLDMDRDGDLEVVTAKGAYDLSGAPLRCWSGFDGSAVSTVPIWDAEAGGFGIVVANAESLVAHRGDGSIRWQLPIPNPAFVGWLAAADLDGDASSEVVYALGSQLRMVDGSGALQWSVGRMSSGRDGPVLHDFASDGLPELLITDEAGVAAFDAVTGVELGRFVVDMYTAGEFDNLLVADIDGDGDAEVVVPDNERAAFVALSTDPPEASGLALPLWTGHRFSLWRDSGQEIPPEEFSWRSTGFVSVPRDPATDLVLREVQACRAADASDELLLRLDVANAGLIEYQSETPIGVYVAQPLVPEAALAEEIWNSFSKPIPNRAELELDAPPLYLTERTLALAPGETSSLVIRVPSAYLGDPSGWSDLWVAAGFDGQPGAAGGYRAIECGYSNNWAGITWLE